MNYSDLKQTKDEVQMILNTKDPKQITNLMKELNASLTQWSREYYVLNNPSVDDYTYDQVYKLLQKCEEEYPHLILKDSIVYKVGFDSSNKFEKYMHAQPMLSLENSYNSDDILAFSKHIEKELGTHDNLSFVCEPKIDGLSISCIYKDGKLFKAVTRGNGIVGEDVTNNVKTIKSIPLTISYPYDLEVRGEVYLPKSKLEELNANNQNNFANTRNTASGALRNLDPQITASRGLDAWFYFIPDYITKQETSSLKNEELFLHTQYSDLLFLNALGFKVALDYIKKVDSLKDIENYINWFDTQRNNLNFDTDGTVIKLNNKDYYNILGTTSKFPKYAIAYKYPPTLAQTKLIDILITVGRTGKINYTAKLEPVLLNGSMITYATLHNADYIKEHDIRIGDVVSLYKAAEVIPKIANPVLNVRPKDAKEFIAPKYCVSCNSLLEKNADEVDLYCMNPNCEAKKLQQLIYFASKPIMNLEGLNNKTIEKFFETNYLKDITDFYRLKEHYNDIINTAYFRIKNKSLDKMLINIENSKKLDYSHLLSGLGIKFVGKETAKLLTKYYNSFDDIFKASKDELSKIEGIGPEVSNSIFNWGKNEDNIKLIKEFEKLGLKTKKEETKKDDKNIDTNSAFYEKTFVITGSFETPRSEIETYLIKNYNAKITSNVSKNTDYVLVGNSPGSKYDKALSLNIKIIDNLDDIKIENKKISK